MRKIFLIIFIVLAIFYWQLWQPGPKAASDFPVISDSTLSSFFDYPRVWLQRGSAGFGEYIIYSLWNWPFMAVIGFFARVGLGFALIEKLFYFCLPLILGATGTGYLITKYGFSRIAVFSGVLVYLINTYFILLLDGGQLMMVLAYGFFPWSYVLASQSIEGSIKSRLLAGLGVYALGICDVRIVFVLVIILLLKFIFGLVYLRISVKKYFVNWTLACGTIGLVFIGLSAYWVFPIVLNPISEDSYQKLTQMSADSFVKLGHAILLLAPNWPDNVYGRITPLKIEFIILPLLVLLALIVRFKDRRVRFWIFVAAVGIFLTKGNGDPLPQIYGYMYKHIPGFSLFRDSTKFFFLITLSYSILISFSIDWLGKVFDSHKKIRIMIPLIIIIYLIILAGPIWEGKMTGILSSRHPGIDIFRLNSKLSEEDFFSRVVWLPARSPFGYSDSIKVPIDGLELAKMRPFAINNIGLYERFNFLREAPFMGELFDVFGIGYIVDPPLNTQRADLSKDNVEYYELFLNQLRNLKWLTDQTIITKIPLLKVNEHQDNLFISNNLWFVIGSDKIYAESTKSAGLKLANNALVFTEESIGGCSALERFPNAKVTLFYKSENDLLACFFEQNSIIAPAKNLPKEPNGNGWWKRDSGDFAWLKNFLETKYGFSNQDFDLAEGWAISEGPLTQILYSKKIATGKELFARVMENPKGGKITFMQGTNKLGDISTMNKTANLRWVKVGKIIDDSPITIKTEGDLNIINVIAVVDENELKAAKEKVRRYQDRVKEFSEQNVTRHTPQITYHQIDPTTYKIKISGLTSEAALIFSDSYSGFWRLNGRTPVKVYSMLNGFMINQDGEYILQYSLQENVYIGLAISAGSLITIIFILFKFR